MIQLKLSMMEKYDIPNRRPAVLRALQFGADRMMLYALDRMIDAANANGADVGVACIAPGAAALKAQDGMFTLLVRGETGDRTVNEERVVQCILKASEPDGDLTTLAENRDIEMLFCHARPGAAEAGLIADFLEKRKTCGLPQPTLYRISDRAEEILPDAENLLVDSFCQKLNERETALARQKMNYRDDLIAWAEPYLKCSFSEKIPERLRCAGKLCASDYAGACDGKARILDAALTMCAAGGYLGGKDSFADVMKDDIFRRWIGRTFYDEILTPEDREGSGEYVISAFERLENSMNDMRFPETGRGMIGNIGRTLLPSIRRYADREFDAPKGLSLALAAAIMLYAGVRRDADGRFCVARGESSDAVIDDPEILEAFSRLSHDMPAESLAYAALADRSIWSCDLREIDGLEMCVAYDLSSIQRIGFRETVKNKYSE